MKLGRYITDRKATVIGVHSVAAELVLL